MPSRRPWVLIAAAAAGLAGPTRTATDATAHAPAGRCDRADAAALIGRPLDAAESVLGDRPYGVVTTRPKMRGGLIVTGDYRPERLSLVVDRGGRIARVRCG